MLKQYFDLLGLSEGASMQEIKVAYKKACKRYHPDNIRTGNSDKFQEIHKAYKLLISKSFSQPSRRGMWRHRSMFKIYKEE